MSKRKKKESLAKLDRKGRVIDPILARARNLRASLLRRAPNQEIKDTTPSVKELERWLRLPRYICRYSLEELDLESLTIDHQIPLNRFGNNSFNNLCFCSSAMNTTKGSMTDEEFVQLLELIKTWEDGGEYLIKRLRMGNNIFAKK